MNKVVTVKLGAYRTPEGRESSSDKFMRWGVDNAYPDYLLTLFDRSATHGAIVKGKVDYIVGEGVINSAGNVPTWKPNKFHTATEFLRRIATDIEVFGGYAIQVIKRADGRGISEMYHIPFQYLRLSKSKEKLYYHEDWKSAPRKYTEFSRYYTGTPEPTSIIYEDLFTAGGKTYPKPEYSQGIAAIQTDVEISNFHLNNIVNGFSGGTLISFNNGVPTDDEQDNIVKEIKSQHGGTDNAGDIVVVFSDGQDRAPTILDLKGNDLDKKFEQLKTGTQEQIFVSHRVVSPMIFGIRTAGQLGGRTEMLDAYEMFKRTYIEPKQRKLLSTLQYCAMIMGSTEVLNIVPLAPVGVDIPISESTIAANLTREEIRSLISDKFGIDLATEQKQIQCKHSKHDETDDKLLKAFELLGVNLEDYDIIDEVDVDMTTKQIKVNQAELNDDENKVLKVIKDNPKVTAVTIAEALDIEVEKALKAIEVLSEKNFIRAIDAGFETTPTGTKVADAIEGGVEILTMYRYAWAPGFSDDDIETSRVFCRKMLNAGKMYSRQDIDTVENDLGSDVWATRGGWYHNPENNTNVPYCRHVWKQVISTKK